MDITRDHSGRFRESHALENLSGLGTMNGKALHIALAAAAVLALAGLAWFGLVTRPAWRAAEEVRLAAAELSSALVAEDWGPDRLLRAKKFLGGWEPRTRPGRDLRLGALAFLDDRPREAAECFRAVADALPDQPRALSFLAAANLRLGNAALAVDDYGRALDLGRRSGESPVNVSNDQLGLALGLFLLGRPAEASPLAEDAWRTRRERLGPEAPETLSAATRLATIYVALNEAGRAETLLAEVLGRAGSGGAETSAALEEARLLFTVVYNQSGRQAELKALLDLANGAVPTGPGGAAVADRVAVSPADAVRALRPKDVAIGDLAEWDRLAEGLAGHNDRLAAELRIRSLLGRAELAGLDLWSPAARSERLALARAWVETGRFALAGKLLRDLAGEITDQDSAEFTLLTSLTAESLEGEGRFAEAENYWRTAAEAAEARLAATISAESGPDPAEVYRALRSRLGLAENYLRQGRVTPEAEIELLGALAHWTDLGITDPAWYPAGGQVYLRLASLMRDMNRPAESATYYRLAKAGAEARLKANPERPESGEPPPDGATDAPTVKPASGVLGLSPTERRELLAIITEATPPDPKNPVLAPPDPPEPDLLRLELAALKALGRLDEFEAILAPALANAAANFGLDSRPYLRYYSLKLKWLEESGRVKELTAELIAQADQPPGQGEAEQALNRAGALMYAAKVNDEAGRRSVAVDLYQKASASLEGRTESRLTDRRKMIEAALAELAAPAKKSGEAESQ